MDTEDAPSSPPDSSASKDEPITEDGAPEASGDTFKLPQEFFRGKRFKSGDEVTLKVVMSDDDGIEVSFPAKPKTADEEISELPED